MQGSCKRETPVRLALRNFFNNKEHDLTGAGSGGDYQAFAGPSGLCLAASVNDENSLARYSGGTFRPRFLEEPTTGGQQLEPAPSTGLQPC
mmetsp:Transcript_100667/g.324821  ORF Transcript_100667/g.324821 Transcript_100667/m.324821 type:complete len:91 (-) Transcript_100667:4-276(-)